MWVLKSPKADPRDGQYICFHVFGDRSNGFTSCWTLERLHCLLSCFDTKALAEERIAVWRDSKQPLPDDVVAVEVEHRNGEHGFLKVLEVT